MKKISLPVAIGLALVVIVLGFTAFYLLAKDESTSKNKKTTDTPSKTCTTYEGRVEEQCIEDYIGLSQADAVARAEKHGYKPKIISIDGVPQGNTDERAVIIWLEIENDIVTKASFNIEDY